MVKAVNASAPAYASERCSDTRCAKGGISDPDPNGVSEAVGRSEDPEREDPDRISKDPDRGTLRRGGASA